MRFYIILIALIIPAVLILLPYDLKLPGWMLIGIILGLLAIWIDDRLPRLRQHVKSFWEDK